LPLPTATFFETVTAAVAEFTERGFESQEQLDGWLRRLRAAAERDLIPERELEARVRDALRSIYERMVERGGLLKRHLGTDQFTIARVKPRLHAELSRRTMASAQLIKLNRVEAIETTLRRFAGWATSVPPGGTDVIERNPVKSEIRRSLVSLPFRERRVAIDQGHKFLANLSEILATDGGAVAGVWHQHYTRNPRPEHTAREGKVYAVRGSWAMERGLMRAGPAGYADEITKPGEEILCRCSYTWLHALRNLPAEMLTQRGRDELARVRRAA